MAMTGLEDVLKQLDSAIADIEGSTLDGMWDAGLQIQRSAQQRLQPSVVTGNLRASAYTRRAQGFVQIDPARLDPTQSKPVPTSTLDNAVEIGFTANYAIYAHENTEGNRAPKFLEHAITENRDAIIQIIQKRAKL